MRERALAKANGQPRQSGRGWGMEQARRTPWGQGVAWALLGAVADKDGELDWLFGAPEGTDIGFLQLTFRPYFPEWEKVFGLGPTEGGRGCMCSR